MNRLAASTCVAVALVFTWPSVRAIAQRTGPNNAKAEAKAYVPAKLPWGEPDLSGIYTNKDEVGIPFEKPDALKNYRSSDDVSQSEFAEIVRKRIEAREIGNRALEVTGSGPEHWYEDYNAKNSRLWLVVDPPDGKIPPLSAEGQRRAAALAAAQAGRGPSDSYTDRSLFDRCISRGVPGSMMLAPYNMNYRIVQSPGIVSITYEMIHETRIIPTDGRPHVGSQIQTYMGDARGHFEGNTFVVETTNFRAPNRGASEKLRLIERFRPIAPNKLEWSVTFDDPATWTRPWTHAMNLTKEDPGQDLFEYACHEGNYGLRHILSGARAEDAAAKEAAAK